MRTLLVDDDPAFRRLASLALEAAGVEHGSVSSAQEALRRLQDESFDLLLLDLELPGMSGVELLRHLREQGKDIPVVLVTIRDEITELASGLRSGADDYIVKPFDFDELLARLRAVLRRSRGMRTAHLGNLEVDPLRRAVKRSGRAVELTQREFEVLWVLIQGQERIVTRKEFLFRVWGMKFEPGTNFIQVHVSRLRAKLEPIEGFRIETVRGEGYRLVSVPALSPSPEASTEGAGLRPDPGGEPRSDGATRGAPPA